MLSIKIEETVKTRQDLVYLLEEIAKQVEKGNHSGYYPHWELQGEEEDVDENE